MERFNARASGEGEWKQRAKAGREEQPVMRVFCPEHLVGDSYCFCHQEIEDQMVFCDSCTEWYHYSCVLSKEEMQQELPEKYLCHFCHEWT